MIDFVKIEIIDAQLPGRVRSLTNRPFLSMVDTLTGEEGEGGVVRHDRLNLRLRCYPSGRNFLYGSFHKFANGGLHNHDDLTFTRLRDAIGGVCDFLGTAPQDAPIRALEMGVNLRNLRLPANPLTSVVAYNGRPYDIDTFNGKGYEKRWDVGEGYLKVYDKAKQHNLPEPVFRWEMGTHRMRVLHQHKIPLMTMADLLDPQRLAPVGGVLSGLFDALTIDDIPDPSRLTRTERRLYSQAINPRYWEALTDRYQRSYARQRVDAIRAKYGAHQRETISALIGQKWQELLG